MAKVIVLDGRGNRIGRVEASSVDKGNGTGVAFLSWKLRVRHTRNTYSDFERFMEIGLIQHGEEWLAPLKWKERARLQRAKLLLPLEDRP